MKDDGFSSLLAFGLMIGCGLLWCYGIAVCIKMGEIFWGVVSFVMPPVGVIIGLYNWIF